VKAEKAFPATHTESLKFVPEDSQHPGESMSKGSQQPSNSCSATDTKSRKAPYLVTQPKYLPRESFSAALSGLLEGQQLKVLSDGVFVRHRGDLR
jgi:hypothetical protein